MEININNLGLGKVIDSIDGVIRSSEVFFSNIKKDIKEMAGSLMPEKIVLWIDDIRDPNEPVWRNYIKENIYTNPIIFWATSYDQFFYYITKGLKTEGFPDFISFDSDLGSSDHKDGIDCAKFLVEYCRQNKIPLPDWHIQSMNPPAKEAINSLLLNYRKVVEGK